MPTQPDPERQLTLDRILGHQGVRDYLAKTVGSGLTPQAVLFVGPGGVGKRTLAWALAREIVSAGSDPLKHPGSLKVSRGTHPDVRLWDNTQSPSGQIRVDDIREIGDWAATSPLESPKKIALISPAERMNLSAANGLLKLLEEPPRSLILILTSLDSALLPPTISSRCTRLVLEAVAQPELCAWLLSQTDAESSRAELAARLAEGRPGQALSILESGVLEFRVAIIEELIHLKRHGFAAVFRVADRLGAISSDPAAMLEMTLLILRDSLALRMELGNILNVDLRSELEGLAEDGSAEGILEAASLVAAAIGDIGSYYTPQARMHFLEVLVTGIGRELRRR